MLPNLNEAAYSDNWLVNENYCAVRYHTKLQTKWLGRVVGEVNDHAVAIKKILPLPKGIQWFHKNIITVLISGTMGIGAMGMQWTSSTKAMLTKIKLPKNCLVCHCKPYGFVKIKAWCRQMIIVFASSSRAISGLESYLS